MVAYICNLHSGNLRQEGGFKFEISASYKTRMRLKNNKHNLIPRPSSKHGPEGLFPPIYQLTQDHENFGFGDLHQIQEINADAGRVPGTK